MQQELVPQQPPKPHYLDPKQPGRVDESSIEVMNLELNHLPKDFNDKTMKQWFFPGAHVFNMEAEYDNFTGSCKGKGFVSLRVQDKM